MHYAFNGALQNPAEVVDRGSVHRFVFAKLVYGGTGDMMPGDECIGGLAAGLKRLPERIVNDHNTHLRT